MQKFIKVVMTLFGFECLVLAFMLGLKPIHTIADYFLMVVFVIFSSLSFEFVFGKR